MIQIPHRQEVISKSGYYPSKAEQLVMASKGGSRSELQREPKGVPPPRVPPSVFQGQVMQPSENPLNKPLPKPKYLPATGPGINFMPSEVLIEGRMQELQRNQVNAYVADRQIDRVSRHPHSTSSEPIVGGSSSCGWDLFCRLGL